VDQGVLHEVLQLDIYGELTPSTPRTWTAGGAQQATYTVSPKAAKKLESAGYAEVYDFVGGLKEWEGSGFPLEGRAV
jgi:hypothetical protein